MYYNIALELINASKERDEVAEDARRLRSDCDPTEVLLAPFDRLIAARTAETPNLQDARTVRASCELRH
jgi:hypothetical protein